MTVTVRGKLNEGEKVWLYRGDIRSADSTYVKGGKAFFDLSFAEPCECSLHLADREGGPNMLLYLDRCDTQIEILDGTYEYAHNKFLEQHTTGNATHAAVVKFNDMIFRATGEESPYDKPEFNEALMKAVEGSTLADAYIVWKNGFEFRQSGELNKVKAFLDRLSADVRNTTPVRLLQQNYDKWAPTATGAVLSISAPNMDGKTVSSVDYCKGKKCVLVDFWASWCAPCRKEGKNVKAIYEEFHSKGFDVLGFSLDTKREAWLKAIADDGYTWEQISELKGWDTETTKRLEIFGIPRLYLLDGEGRIVAEDLRGEDLRMKVKEMCGE